MENQVNRFAVWQPWTSTLFRLTLAAVWLVAGWPKLVHSDDTIRAVRAFQLLPEFAVRPWAYGMPLLELLLGVLLLLGLATRLASVITIVMMVIFIFGISNAWAQGLAIDCGCFGGGGGTPVDPVPGYIRDILRDIGLALLAAFLVRWPFSRFSLDERLGLTRPHQPSLTIEHDENELEHNA